MTSNIRHRLALVCLPVAALAAAPAFAQPVPEPPTAPTTGTPAAADASADTGLADIVVTAQKKSENLQSVPISVTAVGGQTIENLHAVTLQGLQGTVPNIQINNFSNTPNTAVFTIRGIGVIEPDPYAGNTVSIVIDGVPQYFSMGALVDLYDIDRIEILRGPQGTLFGANTTGGVINIVTAQPTGEFGGKAEASYGNYNRLDLSAALDVPITDTLAGKVAVSHHGMDGYTKNIVDGSDLGKRDVTILRGYLKYAPGSNFDATLIGEYDRARNGAPIFINGSVAGEAVYLAPGTLLPNAQFPMYRSPCERPGGECRAPDKYLSAKNAEVPDVSDMDTYRATLTMNLRDTAIGDLTSITGYKHFKLLEFTDQDGTPAFLADTRRLTRGWQFSEELRTSFDITDYINVIAGGFFLKTHYTHEQDYRLQFAAPGLLQNGRQDQDNYSVSGFLQSYIDITDRLRAQAGIRYTHEQTEMLASTLTTLDPDGNTSYSGAGNIFINNVAPPRGKKSWDNVGWKLGLDYKIVDGTLLYGYWARGFKSGGFTGRIGLPTDIGPYDPEHVDTFEAGVKTDLFDRHLRINLSGFYTNYRDVQIATIYFTNDQAGTVVQGNSILNAAKAEIKGFELEATALPMDGLTFTGSLAYLDAKYKDFLYFDSNTAGGNVAQFRNLKGFRLQNAPEWSATAGAQYKFDIGSSNVAANILYSYVGSKFLTAINDTPRSKIQRTHLVDANIDLTPGGQDWSIGVWVRNLFDERYMASVYDAPGTEGLAAYQPPRMYGVTVKTKW